VGVAPIHDEDRRRFPLAAALLDLWVCPWSTRYRLFLVYAASRAGVRVTDAGGYATSEPPRFVDVLELLTRRSDDE
jgi:hypothetical protein